MTDLNSLAVFAKVVEAKSFTEAARRLKMPVSTVSRRIAELETELGVQLLERSTRRLRITEVGAEVLEYAQRTAELEEVVSGIVSNHTSTVSGNLRIAAPPSLSDSLLSPILCRYQRAYPDVSVEVVVTERIVDQIGEGVDLAFRVGPLSDSTLVVRRVLTYRHQLVASPRYLSQHKPPRTPRDLLNHRLLAFSLGKSKYNWTLQRANGADREIVTFHPALAMNDYAGLSAALLAGAGIGELPPVVHPQLLERGRLVEVMPGWRFRALDLSVVHAANRFIPRRVRLFKELAAEMAPTLFPHLPA